MVHSIRFEKLFHIRFFVSDQLKVTGIRPMAPIQNSVSLEANAM